MAVRLSIIVPTLDEGALTLDCVARLARFRAAGHELILVDGGSRELPAGSLACAVDRLLISPPGRAVQMNRGAAAARGDILWFLHVDSRIPLDADQAIFDALGAQLGWGRFDIRLSGRHPLLRLVERMMNWRSRVSGIATGDQGIFVHRSLFEQVGGYPEQALMEDIEICRRLKRFARPHALRRYLTTSSRRWERRGILRTVLLMWGLRLAYWLGVSPERLAALYRPCTTTPS
ncbi:MAG: TIGR04283 family arsenosugar biosynthesis glycosyltransferase [Candidatus Thiodiazotropha sp.]